MQHPSSLRFPRLLLGAIAVLAVANVQPASASSRLAVTAIELRSPVASSAPIQLAYELVQPSNMGSGLAVPGDVNVVEEGGFDAPSAAPAAPAEQGHSGVIVGAPVGGSNGLSGLEAERAEEMEARSGRPMGIDSPSEGQIDLETPSTRQMNMEGPSERQLDLETPSARQLDLETPSARQMQLER